MNDSHSSAMNDTHHQSSSVFYHLLNLSVPPGGLAFGCCSQRQQSHTIQVRSAAEMLESSGMQQSAHSIGDWSPRSNAYLERLSFSGPTRNANEPQERVRRALTL